jgi:hypothetical protein
MANATPVNGTKKKSIVQAIKERDICENRCTECGRLKVVNPAREPNKRFSSGNVEVFMYQTGTWSHPQVCFQVGAWRRSSDSFELSRLINADELADLRKALTDAIGSMALKASQTG